MAQQRYYPYGEVRWSSGALPTDYQFTAQRREASLGIYDYGARFYSPYLGRFLSADVLVPGIGSQALSRYMYVNGNVLRYDDPSGHHGNDRVVAFDPYGMGGGGAAALLLTATLVAASQLDELGTVIGNARDRLIFAEGNASASSSAASAAGSAASVPPNPLDPKSNKRDPDTEVKVKRANGDYITDIDSIETTPEGDIWLVEEKQATWAQDPVGWAQEKILAKGQAYVEAIQNGCNPQIPNTTNIGFRFTGGPLQADLLAEVESALSQLQALYPDFNFTYFVVP